jgi:hypothetical protein
VKQRCVHEIWGCRPRSSGLNVLAGECCSHGDGELSAQPKTPRVQALRDFCRRAVTSDRDCSDQQFCHAWSRVRRRVHHALLCSDLSQPLKHGIAMSGWRSESVETTLQQLLTSDAGLERTASKGMASERKPFVGNIRCNFQRLSNVIKVDD